MDELRQEDIRRLKQTMPFPKEGKGRFVGRRTWIAVAAVALVGVFFMPEVASMGQAGFANYISFGFTMLLYYITSFVGQMLLILVGALIHIAQYNGFVTSAPVANGWTIVRDIANMFFIVALLLIAFGTMLGLGNYQYEKTLPRFVMMAILVNFSRTICGLIIDFSQVVMLTFVNGFKEAAGGNFVDAFQITQLMQLQPPGGSGGDTRDISSFNWAIMMSMFLALVFVGVATLVIVVMIAVLVVRIVYLWLLIVMSPLAFLSSAIPISKASGFYKDWWEKFNNQVLVGPFLAFFLWLSLISVASGGIAEDGFPDEGPGSSETADVATQGGFQNIGIDGIQQFIIAIGLLLGGLAMAQQMSGSAVAMGKGIAKGAGKVAWRGAKLGAKAGAYGVGRIPVGRVDPKTGRRMNLASFGTAATARMKETGLYKTFSKEGRAATQSQREISALRAMGMTDAADMKQMSLVKEKSGQLGKKYSSGQLRKLAKDDRASQADKQGAVMALAERADSSLWGGGEKVSKMVAEAGGSADLEKSIRLTMKKKGDKDALIKSGADMQSYMGTLNSRQKGNELRGIDKAVQADENGEMTNPLAVDKMLSIDGTDFASFSAALRKQVGDALLLAAEVDPSRAAEIETQFDSLYGAGTFSAPPSRTQAADLKSDMDAKVAGGRAAKAKEGRLEEESFDLNVQRQLAGADKSSRNEAAAAFDIVKEVKEKLARGVNPTTLTRDIDHAMTQLDVAATGSGIDVKDKSGASQKDEKAMKQTTLYKDLQNARVAAAAGKGNEAQKFMDAAAVSTGAAARAHQLSPERRRQYYEAASIGSTGYTRAQNTADKLTSAATNKESKREAKRLYSQVKGIRKTVLNRSGGKGGVLSDDMQKMVDDVTILAKQIKKEKDFNTRVMGDVAILKGKMDEINKSLA
ncbi:MAG: hypothetical protein U9Q03_01580 [Patescibacteria group bacterium]|nr:hypothetical protein [Patescibacteria group bacterium]